MQGRLPSTDAHPGRRQNSTATFAAACGLRGPLRFMVENTETGQAQTFDVVEPFVLIGQSPGCHLRLLHPDVSFRHAYCQVLEGRLYVYDLDTEHGTVWGTGVQREGPLTPDSRLQIGPFVVRLSRAPAFTCSLQPTPEDWQPENEPLENVRLWFENATSRTSHSALRPLRRQLTILGRSNTCHLKLSNNSVSKTHCAIVRTETGCWVVDLLGRNGTLLNGQQVRFASIGSDDSLSAGRFRMKIRELVRSDNRESSEHETDFEQSMVDSATTLPAQSRVPPLVVQAPPVNDVVIEQQLARARQTLAVHSTTLPGVAIPDGPRGTSDALILAMMEQFSHLQQQLLSHTQQQMSMLTEMFATLHKAQNEAVMDQLRRIQEITSELNELRAQKPVPTAVVDNEVLNPPSIGKQIADSTEPQNVAMPESQLQPAIDSDSVLAPTPDAPPHQLLEATAEQAINAASTDAPLSDVAESGQRFDETPLCDDSDVVPVASWEVESEVNPAPIASEEGEAIDEECVASPEATSDQAANDPTRAARPHPAAQGRQDGQSHAHLTMRISELERERKSHWKKLMQLVGAALDD